MKKKCISAGEEKEEDSTCVSNVRIGYDLMVDFFLVVVVASKSYISVCCLFS